MKHSVLGQKKKQKVLKQNGNGEKIANTQLTSRVELYQSILGAEWFCA